MRVFGKWKSVDNARPAGEALPLQRANFCPNVSLYAGKPPDFLPAEIIPAILPANRRAGTRHFQKTVRRQSRGAREKAGMDAPEYCRWRWRFPHLPRINERFALRYRLPRT